MALHMMLVRMMPAAPTKDPDTISTLLLMAKPARAGGQTRVAVQQRDDHRHVGTADRHHGMTPSRKASASTATKNGESGTGVDDEQDATGEQGHE